VSAFCKAAFLSLTLTPVRAQSTAANDTLFETVQSLDTQLFDAYNHCDLATMSSLVSDDLEFYHDKTGLSVGKQVFIEGIKNNTCGKVTRELVVGASKCSPWPTRAPSRSVFIDFTIPEMPPTWVKRSSFTSGTTRNASGWSLASSATTTNR
jgi:hypothetical protein